MPDWVDELRRQEVVDRIKNDPRTRKRPGTCLGWPAEKIQKEALEWGQADFDKPLYGLTGADRAMLYAYFNQPRHLRELRATLGELFGSADRVGMPTVLDLGCGPFTAGLALAAVVGPDRAFRYFGVDISLEMRSLGATLAEAARQRGALHAQTTVNFGGTLDEHDLGKPRWDVTLIIASYLLASSSLNIATLSAAIIAAVERCGSGMAFFLYLNSPKSWPNRNWPDLSSALVAAGFEVRLDEVEDVRCALLVRPASTLRPIPGVA